MLHLPEKTMSKGFLHQVIRYLISLLPSHAIGTSPVPGSLCLASIEPKDMEAGPAFDFVGSMDDGFEYARALVGGAHDRLIQGRWLGCRPDAS